MERLPSLRRVGLIGDVHGEAAILEQVIRFLRCYGAEKLLCTGDITDGVGNVDLCLTLLRKHRVYTVLGNHDRWCLHGELRNRPECTFLNQLSPQNQQFLQQLPVIREFTTPLGRAMLCHGIGQNDMAKVPEERSLSLVVHPELQDMLKGQHYRYLLNGHSHHRMARTFGSLTVINGGTIRRDHQPGFVLIDFEEDWAQAYNITEGSRMVKAEPLVMPVAIAAS